MSGVGIWFEVPAHAADPARHRRRRPRAAARPVGPHRDRRRVPALGDVRPDGADLRRAVLPAAGVDPAARQGVRGQGRRAGRLRGDPRRRGDPGHLPARPDEGRAGAAADPGHEPDPRRGGGAAHALRPRGDRLPDAGGLSRRQLRTHRTAVAAVAAIVAENPVQPAVYASVGLDPREARAAARANEHYRSKLREASAGLVAFLREVGLIGGPSERLWRCPASIRRQRPAPSAQLRSPPRGHAGARDHKCAVGRPALSPGRAGSCRGRSRPPRRG